MLSPSRPFAPQSSKPHDEGRDLEGTNTSDDAEIMNSVFNEMVELKMSFRAVKTSVLILFGLVIVLLLVTMSVSFASLVDSNNISVDVNPNSKTTDGKVFLLPEFTFPVGGYANGNISRLNPFVCVGVPSVRSIADIALSVSVVCHPHSWIVSFVRW
jgi:hypothetical protein